MINFGSSLTIIDTTWPKLKEKIELISRPYHYQEDSSMYEIFIIDEVIVYRTQIMKGAVAENADVTQELNDEYKLEFETDYKEQANAPLSSAATVTTSTLPQNDHEMIRHGRCFATIDASQNMSDPVEISFQFPVNIPLMQLWGCFAHVEGYGEQDYIAFEIVDKDNVLGYGENVILKEYDEMWCSIINKMSSPMLTPDGAPGMIIGGLYSVALYHCTDATKTNIRFWSDHILTVQS